jgi:hypothetical protein
MDAPVYKRVSTIVRAYARAHPFPSMHRCLNLGAREAPTCHIADSSACRGTSLQERFENRVCRSERRNESAEEDAMAA